MGTEWVASRFSIFNSFDSVFSWSGNAFVKFMPDELHSQKKFFSRFFLMEGHYSTLSILLTRQ